MVLESKKKIFIIIFIFIALILSIYFIEKRFSLNELKDKINSFGSLVPLVLLIIIIISSSVGLVFTIPVAIAALLLNGYLALFISILGLTLGAAISFFLSRYYGRNYIERNFINKISKLKNYDKRLHQRGFLTVFFLRLIVLIPFELINIIAGLSRIKFKDFIYGTFLGIIPGTLLTIYFIRSTKSVWSTEFFFALCLMTIFSLLPLMSKEICKQKDKHHIFLNSKK